MRQSKQERSRALRAGMFMGAAFSAFAGLNAQAQQPTVQPVAAVDEADEEIVVTGSRLRRSAAEAPQPLIQLGREDLLQSGEANVIDYLADLPALQTSFVAEDSTGGSLGTGGLSLLDLRNLGPNRTLVLVDGRRQVGSAYFASSAVDIDTIPRLLIENVEVITGGSSAVYGADAVTGVVNFTLRRDFEGLEIDTSLSQINQDGELNGRLSGLWGANLFDDRLNVYVSGEYERSEEVTNFGLDWIKDERVLLQNDLDPTNVANGPNNDGVQDVILGTGYGNIGRSRGGTLTLARTLQPSALNDPDFPVTPCNTPSAADPFNANCFVNDPGFSFTFNNAGVARALNFGTGRASAGANRNNVQGSPDAFPLSELGSVSRLPEQENYRFQTGFNFALTPAITVFGEAKYVQDFTNNSSSPQFFNVGIRAFTATETTRFTPTTSVNAFSIGLDNAYLDPAIRTLITNNQRAVFAAPTLTAPGAQTSTVADARALFSNIVPNETRLQENERELWRFVGGVRGDVGDVGFLKNVSYEVGYTVSEQEDLNIENLLDSERYAFAADAVVDTAGVLGTAGAIVCRVRLRAAQGVPIPIAADIQRNVPVAQRRNYAPNDPAITQCQPMNIFGAQGIPASLESYLQYQQTRGFASRQEDLLAFASGEFADLWGAGPIRAAIGAEGRKETFSGGIGPSDRANRLIFGNVYTATPEQSYDVGEWFVETDIPLIKDQPGFQLLDFGAAYRVSNYSNIGVTHAWNFQGQWRPVEDIMFRYTRGRAVRAPQLNELFRGPAQTFVAISDNCSRPVIDATADATIRANRNRNCLALGVPATYVDPNPTTNNPGVNGPNPNLREEESTSQTFSVIVSPRVIPNFELILDYYDIQIDDVVSALGVQTLVNLCVDNETINAAACGLFTRNPATFEINNFTQGGFNYASQRVKGMDFAARYRLGLDAVFSGAPGDLQFGLRGNYSIRNQGFFDINDRARATDADGFVGEPRVRLLAETTYERGPWAFTWEADFQSSQEIFDSRVLIDDPDQRAPSLLETDDFWQHDLTARWDVNDNFRMRFGVINLLDEEPSASAELAPTASLSGAGSVDQFDLFGRRFFIGVNFRR